MGDMIVKPAAIVPTSGRRIEDLQFQQLMHYCQTLAKTEAGSKIGTAEEILLIVEMGAGIGLNIPQSMNSIASISGKLALYGGGLIGVLQASPLFENEHFHERFVGEEPPPPDLKGVDEAGRKLAIDNWLGSFPNDFTAECTMKRRGADKVVYTFTVQDARVAGLWGRRGKAGQDTPWTQYPKRMLQMKARSWCANDKFSDVLKGLAIYEDIVDVEFTERKRSRREIVQAGKQQADEVYNAIFTDD